MAEIIAAVEKRTAEVALAKETQAKGQRRNAISESENENDNDNDSSDDTDRSEQSSNGVTDVIGELEHLGKDKSLTGS